MPTLKVEDIQLYVYGHIASFLGTIPDYPRKAFVGKSATTHKSRGWNLWLILLTNVIKIQHARSVVKRGLKSKL